MHITPMWSRDKTRQKLGVVVHEKLGQAAGTILTDLENIVVSAHGSEFKRFFQLLTHWKSMTFASYTKEEVSWFSNDNDKTLEDLSGTKGTMFLEGIDTFINNTRQSEIPGVFKGDNSLNSGTIGLMGADSKQAETWTQVTNSTSRKHHIQLKHIGTTSSSSSDSSSSEEETHISLITWCNSVEDGHIH